MYIKGSLLRYGHLLCIFLASETRILKETGFWGVFLSHTFTILYHNDIETEFALKEHVMELQLQLNDRHTIQNFAAKAVRWNTLASIDTGDSGTDGSCMLVQ